MKICYDICFMIENDADDPQYDQFAYYTTGMAVSASAWVVLVQEIRQLSMGDCNQH